MPYAGDYKGTRPPSSGLAPVGCEAPAINADFSWVSQYVRVATAGTLTLTCYDGTSTGVMNVSAGEYIYGHFIKATAGTATFQSFY